jgi:hypothetical protein
LDSLIPSAPNYHIDSWLNKKSQVGSVRTVTRKNTKKRHDFQELGQNQKLTFNYDNALEDA